MIRLLETRQPLDAQQIRAMVNGYNVSDSPEAFSRKFERDKKELRELGIPLKTVKNSYGQESYFIDKNDYALGDINCTAQEMTILAMAASLWQSVDQRELTRKALTKLRSSGLEISIPHETEIDYEHTSLLLSAIGTEENLSAILEALHTHHQIRFSYAKVGSDEIKTRTIEPWLLFIRAHNWYLVGYDLARQERRSFKLSRIHGTVELLTALITHPVDIDKLYVEDNVFFPHHLSQDSHIVLWIKKLCAQGLERTIRTEIEHVNSMRHHPCSYTVHEESYQGELGTRWSIIGLNDDKLLAQILAQGNNVVVFEPRTLQEKVISQLESILKMHEGASTQIHNYANLPDDLSSSSTTTSIVKD